VRLCNSGSESVPTWSSWTSCCPVCRDWRCSAVGGAAGIMRVCSCCPHVARKRIGLLHLVRYRSLRQQLTIATLLHVVAVATTVLINVQLMFLSAHDSLVILIALLVSVLLAAVGAWLVVRRISRASRRLGAGLHQLVSDSSSGSRVAAAETKEDAAPRELAHMLEDLAETRRTLAKSRTRELGR